MTRRTNAVWQEQSGRLEPVSTANKPSGRRIHSSSTQVIEAQSARSWSLAITSITSSGSRLVSLAPGHTQITTFGRRTVGRSGDQVPAQIGGYWRAGRRVTDTHRDRRLAVE